LFFLFPRKKKGETGKMGVALKNPTNEEREKP
jgi:hypothetical protein